MGFTEQSWRQWARQQLEASFHVYIHLDHKSPWKQALAIATSPLVLFMHLTNPSMHIGQPLVPRPLPHFPPTAWACPICLFVVAYSQIVPLLSAGNQVLLVAFGCLCLLLRPTCIHDCSPVLLETFQQCMHEADPALTLRFHYDFAQYQQF